MYAMTSNPLLQSLEGFFEGLVEQMRIDLCCGNRSMSKRLLHNQDVRRASVQSGCEAMPERMRCDSLGNSSFDNPLIESTLNLTCGNSLLQLADEERLRIGEDLLAFFQVAMQDRPQLGVEKAIDNLSSLGLNGDPLLQQIDVGDVQTDQLRQPDAGMQKQVYNHQVAVCLPPLLRSDGLQKNTFLILNQEDGRLSVLVFDLNPDGWIVIDMTGVGQPAKESFDGCPGAIDGRSHFLFTVGLLLHRIGKKEIIGIDGSYRSDITITSKLVDQQVQVTLLGSNGMGRSAIGKLVIHELPDRLIECHSTSSVSDSSRGCQLQIDWLVMYKTTFLPMYSLIGSVILRSPTSMKVSLSSLKVTSASELSYRSDFTSAIRSSYVFSDIIVFLSLSCHTDEFTLIGNAEFREITGFESHPAGRSFQLVACGDARQLEAIRFTIQILFQVSETVELPAAGLSPFNELLFIHFPHCGLQLWFGLVSNFTVQGCAGSRWKIKLKSVNATE